MTIVKYKSKDNIYYKCVNENFLEYNENDNFKCQKIGKKQNKLLNFKIKNS